MIVHYTTFLLTSDSTYVISKLDNQKYLLRSGKHKSSRHKDASVDALAEINIRITKLIEHLKRNYLGDVNKAYFIKKLDENYNNSVISEAAIDNRYTTYTVDKQNIHICLRTRDDQENLYDMDILMYIVLHELAHLCNYNRKGVPVIGHGVEFREIFKFLTKEAIKVGVYTYVDFESNPREYCGIIVNSNILREP